MKEFQRIAAETKDIAQRIPYFCSGCPHNSSTVVPEGMRALCGHRLPLHGANGWTARQLGYTQMGGEGANWVGEAPFSNRKHVFQNLGDGTYNHSGYMAIRAAIAAERQYHLQDSVQRCGRDDRRPAGRRPADACPTSRIRCAAEGVQTIVVDVTDEHRTNGPIGTFPSDVPFIIATISIAVQKDCANSRASRADLRPDLRDRKTPPPQTRHTYPDPKKRVFINALVCEGCGDCGMQSFCVSVLPLETE